MKEINFTKMVASGNDFVVIENIPRASASGFRSLAKKICHRKFGAGADGLLVVGKSSCADIRMRIFNADGTEAEMCGNGARCSAFYASRKLRANCRRLKIETKAGIIDAEVSVAVIRVKLTDPRDTALDIPLKINNRPLKVNFINTGVPHVVIIVEGLEKIDVAGLGRQIRYHDKFMPRGTNVDFIEILNNDSIKIRTYERGVEDETLACGTGSVASALIFSLKNKLVNQKIFVHTKSGEILKVNFATTGNSFYDVWLEGKAKIVYTGCWRDE